MKTYIIAITCIAIVNFALPAHAARRKPASEAQPSATPQPIPLAASDRLSRFLNAHLDAILAPLDAKGFEKQQLIVDLRETFADSMAHAPQPTKPVFQAAMEVCDALSQASGERQKAIASMKASTAVHGESDLDARRKDRAGWLEQQRERREQQQRNQEAAKTDAFFTAGQKAQWTTRATQLRQNIQQLYSRERDLERQSNSATPSAAPTTGT